MAKGSPNAGKKKRPRNTFPNLETPVTGQIWVREVPPKIQLGDTIQILTKNLKYWIRKRGYTTYEGFAFQVGIPKSTLSQILNHNRDPRLGTIEQFAFMLGLSVAELTEPPNPLPPDWDDL